MTGKGHLIIGLSTTVACVSVLHSSIEMPEAVASVIIGMIAALAPDLDAPHSMLKSRVLANGRPAFVRVASNRVSVIEQMILTFFGMIEMVIRMAIYLLATIPSLFLQHRAATHYFITPFLIWMGLAVVLFVTNQTQVYGLVFFLSYVSHILGDMCTKSGVPALKPFYTETLYALPKKLRFKTLQVVWNKGRFRYVMSFQEQIIAGVVVCCAIAIVLVTLG